MIIFAALVLAGAPNAELQRIFDTHAECVTRALNAIPDARPTVEAISDVATRACSNERRTLVAAAVAARPNGQADWQAEAEAENRLLMIEACLAVRRAGSTRIVPEPDCSSSTEQNQC